MNSSHFLFSSPMNLKLILIVSSIKLYRISIIVTYTFKTNWSPSIYTIHNKHHNFLRFTKIPTTFSVILKEKKLTKYLLQSLRRLMNEWSPRFDDSILPRKDDMQAQNIKINLRGTIVDNVEVNRGQNLSECSAVSGACTR